MVALLSNRIDSYAAALAALNVEGAEWAGEVARWVEMTADLAESAEAGLQLARERGELDEQRARQHLRLLREILSLFEMAERLRQRTESYGGSIPPAALRRFVGARQGLELVLSIDLGKAKRAAEQFERGEGRPLAEVMDELRRLP